MPHSERLAETANVDTDAKGLKVFKVNRRLWNYGGGIYRIREVESPILKTFRGFRILVAIPNMDGTKPWTNVPWPMFTRSRLILMTSDYSTLEEANTKLDLLTKFLLSKGFTKIEDQEDYALRMLSRMRWPGYH